MASVPIRSFVKGICWESIGFIITLFAVYLIYGNFLSSLVFTLILTAIKILLFFVHERLWKKIRWGKYHIVGGKKVFDKVGKKSEKNKGED
jgi:adenylylsulfate kinase